MVVLLECNVGLLLANNSFKYESYTFGTHYYHVIDVIHLMSLNIAIYKVVLTY